MAISDSFFGLRRKSTKSHTYSTLRGEQITKERVTKVANPQTSDQMQQRLKMPLVAAARTNLQGILNHSFQGIEYGQKSLRYFSSLNLKKNFLHVGTYVPKGEADCGVADYQISKGTLPSIECKGGVYSKDNGFPEGGLTFNANPMGFVFQTAGGTMPHSKHDFYDIANQKTMIDTLIKSIPGAQVGDQITFICSYTTGEINWEYAGSNGQPIEANIGRHNFAIARIILDNQDPHINFFTSAEDEDPETRTTAGWKYYEQEIEGSDNAKMYGMIYEEPGDQHISMVIVYGFSDAIIADDRSEIDISNDRMLFCAYPYVSGNAYNQLPEMGAAILSRKINGVWQRSNARFATMQQAADMAPAITVLGTYRNSKTTAASKKYLNDGPNATGIIGDTE